MAADAKLDILDFRTLTEALAKEAGLPRKKVILLLKSLAKSSATALKQGKTVRIAGLGVLRVRDVPPSTGAATARPPKRIVLVPAKQLTASVLGG